MITSALLLLAVSSRSEPLKLPPALRTLKFSLSGSGLQVGRAEALRWMAVTQMDFEDIYKALAGWQKRSVGRSQYERRIGDVRQFLSIGATTNVSNKRRYVIHIEEEPPEDGTIPVDWPTPYRRGLARIYPTLFSMLRGIDPHRVDLNFSPVGFIVTGTYRVQGRAVDIEKVFEREVADRGWVRVVGKDKVRLKMPNADTRAVGDRLVESVGFMQEGKNVLVELRWFASRGDLVGYSRPEVVGQPAAIPPQSSFSKQFLGSNRACRILPVANFGGRALFWTLERPGPLTSWESLARKLGGEVQSIQREKNPISLIDHRSGTIDVHIEASPGRRVYLTTAPKGWRPSPDFAGFWMPTMVDVTKYTTLNITERRASVETPWPREARSNWPLSHLPKLPLAEMYRQPDEVRFPTRAPAGQFLPREVQDHVYAKWTVEPSAAREAALSKFVFEPWQVAGIQSVHVTKIRQGTYEISAVFR